MLTIFLRNSVCVRRSNKSNVGDAARQFRIIVRQESQLPRLRCTIRIFKQTNLILRENEYMQTFSEDDSIVRSYESNQLGANSPCEDCRTEATFLHKSGFICGVFDGHRGPACSQVISKRLLRYVAAGVIDRKSLQEVIAKDYNSQSFLKCHNDKADFVTEIKNIYENSFTEYVQTISSQSVVDILNEITNAFMRLDDDLSKEALKHTNMRTMAVAMSAWCNEHTRSVISVAPNPTEPNETGAEDPDVVEALSGVNIHGDIGVLQEDALAYLAGYIIRKQNLQEYEDANATSYPYTDLVSKGLLKKPSQDFYNGIKCLETVFNNVNANEIACFKNLKQHLIDQSTYVDLPETVKRFFFKCRIFFRIRDLNNRFKEKKAAERVKRLKKFRKIIL